MMVYRWARSSTLMENIFIQFMFAIHHAIIHVSGVKPLSLFIMAVLFHCVFWTLRNACLANDIDLIKLSGWKWCGLLSSDVQSIFFRNCEAANREQFRTTIPQIFGHYSNHNYLFCTAQLVNV